MQPGYDQEQMSIKPQKGVRQSKVKPKATAEWLAFRKYPGTQLVLYKRINSSHQHNVETNRGC